MIEIKERESKLFNEFMGMAWPFGGFLNNKPEWTQLMEVVEKVEAIYDDHDGFYGVFISSNSCTVQGTKLNRALENLEEYGWVYHGEVVATDKLEATYLSVLRFLKWYDGKN